MGKVATLFVLLFIVPAWADEEHSWRLLTQTWNGSVSVTRDLTKHECDFARARALGQPATDEEKAADDRASQARWDAARAYCRDHPDQVGGRAENGVTVNCNDGHANGIWWERGVGGPDDIRSAECFQ